jgi:hypothetical protein
MGFGGPGWLFDEFSDAYIAGELKDSNGKTVPGSNRAAAYSTTTHAVFIDKKRFLGGWMAGEVLLPLVDRDVQLANGANSRVRGFGSLSVGPGLQWAPTARIATRQQRPLRSTAGNAPRARVALAPSDSNTGGSTRRPRRPATRELLRSRGRRSVR